IKYANSDFIVWSSELFCPLDLPADDSSSSIEWHSNLPIGTPDNWSSSVRGPGNNLRTDHSRIRRHVHREHQAKTRERPAQHHTKMSATTVLGYAFAS